MCYRYLDREISLEQVNVYFTVIGQAMAVWNYVGMQIWEALCIFNAFYSRSSFLDYAG